MNHIQSTPLDLVGIDVTYEKVDFHFVDPVKALFWIEAETAEGKSTMEVPHDHVKPTNHYVLSYVQSGDGIVQLTAKTDSPKPLDQRMGSFGPIAKMYLRKVKYLPTTPNVPLNLDIEIFEARGALDWRHPERPVPVVRIWARFLE